MKDFCGRPPRNGHIDHMRHWRACLHETDDFLYRVALTLKRGFNLPFRKVPDPAADPLLYGGIHGMSAKRNPLDTPGNDHMSFDYICHP